MSSPSKGLPLKSPKGMSRQSLEFEKVKARFAAAAEKKPKKSSPVKRKSMDPNDSDEDTIEYKAAVVSPAKRAKPAPELSPEDLQFVNTKPRRKPAPAPKPAAPKPRPIVATAENLKFVNTKSRRRK